MSKKMIPQFVRLSNGEWWEVPEDCDFSYALRIKEAQIRRRTALKRQPRRQSSYTSGKTTKAKQAAAIHNGLLQNVTRANEPMSEAETLRRQELFEAACPDDTIPQEERFITRRAK